MKYTLRNYIENLEDRVVNKDIYIKDKVLYLTTENNKYKYEHNCWFIFTDKWVNMQGGVPVYEVEENPDENIFITLESEAKDE